MKRLVIVLLTLIFQTVDAQSSQDTLPRFSVRNIGVNKTVISWLNNYPVTKQISIQRSHDSLNGFKTILSVADPTAIQNGFVDTKAPNDHMYYRLFVNLDKGDFFFTPSQKPVWDTARGAIKQPATTQFKVKEAEGITTSAVVKPTIQKKPEWVPSVYVYTNKDGYVLINLPDADRKNYRIKFYEENNSLLFELKTIKHPALTLDKANFFRAGWFHFELFDEDNLVEKNKFFLSKEF